MGFIKNICNWSVLKILVFLVAIASFLMIFTYSMYFGVYLHRPLGDVGDWGSFGSYMGAITGLLAFAGVLYTVMEGKKETKAAKLDADRREAKAIEQAVKREERDIFFKLLELHREKASAVIFYDEHNEKEHKGISSFEMYVNVANNLLMDYSFNYCIANMKIEDIDKIKIFNNSDNISFELKSRYTRLSLQIQSKFITQSTQEYVKEFLNNTYLYRNFDTDKRLSLKFSGIYKQLNVTFEIEDMFEALRLTGDILNYKYGHLIGLYFRNMFYMLQTINKFNYDKEYYFKLYRAQLSRNEILICLFNSVSFKSSREFVKLLKDNNILNDLFYKDLFLTQFQNDWQKRELIFIEGIFECYLKKDKERIRTNEL